MTDIISETAQIHPIHDGENGENSGQPPVLCHNRQLIYKYPEERIHHGHLHNLRQNTRLSGQR